MRKVYVQVDARFTADGKIIPHRIVWEDGKVYTIDEVLDIRRAASLKAGGIGMRYLVRLRSTTYSRKKRGSIVC